ncbi:hypothetical protein DPEC_G00106370, partial [Dallia pectoralis]
RAERTPPRAHTITPPSPPYSPAPSHRERPGRSPTPVNTVTVACPPPSSLRSPVTHGSSSGTHARRLISLPSLLPAAIIHSYYSRFSGSFSASRQPTGRHGTVGPRDTSSRFRRSVFNPAGNVYGVEAPCRPPSRSSSSPSPPPPLPAATRQTDRDRHAPPRWVLALPASSPLREPVRREVCC